MEKSKSIKQILLFLFIVVFSFSCSKENELETTELSSNNYFMELSTIEDIANGIYFPSDDGSNLKSTKPKTKTVRGIDEIKNKSKKTSYYIINYEEGGYIILSADKRASPVLGFSINNNFEVDESLYPPNLKFWMEDASAQIEAIQQSSREQSPKEEKAWDRIQHSLIHEVYSLKPEPPPDCWEHTEITTVGPFMEPEWGQEYAYNTSLPWITCNGDSYQVRVGCVPLAMAIVMKINEHPTSYTWSSMPLTYGTTTTANYIEDLWDAINSENSSYPDYDCDETLVVPSVVDDVFEDHFNYTNSSTDSYNYQTVKTDIQNDRPVILVGYDGDEGHAWVCDGYQETRYFYDDCDEQITLYLHMNWGWYGDYNFYFAYNNFDPGNTSWNEDKLMVYNITP